MQDELAERLWTAHHHAFGRWLRQAGLTLRTTAARLADWDGSLHQLVAMSAAFVLTGLSLGFTSSAA